MIVQLKIGPPAPAPAPARDALGLLLECHERIRRFSEMALRIADAKDSPLDQVADAAKQVVRYFGQALPLHVEDEDNSLAPRLQQRAGDVADERRVQEMVDQHEQIELLLAQLMPKWQSLGERPAQPDLIATLGDDTRTLHQAFVAHLELEETYLLPLARRVLSAEELEQIGAEIRQRRA